MSTQNQKGFTLVEIAIVLVIIGLLLGGVLKGQELIKSSKIKATVGEVKSLQAAIYTFQDKYRYLPGDFNAATTTFTGAAATMVDGDGAGDIDNGERGQIFAQLIAAGLISGISDGTDSANGYFRSKFGGTVIVDDGNPFAGVPNVCYNGLTLEIANALDEAVDGTADGTKGDVRRSTTAAYAATGNSVCFKLQ